MVKDTTKRKSIELELAAGEAKYRSLFQNLNSAFALHEIILDDAGNPVDYRFLEVNVAYELIAEKKASEMVGRTFREIKGRDTVEYIEIFGKVALSGEPASLDIYSEKTGRYFHCSVFSSQKGTFALIAENVTAQKELEKDLRLKERRLSMAITATSDAVWEWNPVTNKTYYSPRWYEMLGFGDQQFDMDVEAWEKLCHPDDLVPTLTKISAVAVDHENPGCSAEFRMMCADGRWKWILARGNVVERGADGKPVLISGTNIDVTERKLAEQQLRNLNETLEGRVTERTADLDERNKDLETFSYAISHDLRGPLRVVQGYAKLLAEGCNSDEEAKSYAASVALQSDKISGMLDGILAYSRIGTQKSQVVAVDLMRFIGELIDDVVVQGEYPDVRIESEVEEVHLYTDREALAICLRNLLNNATKFSSGQPEPLVKVTARVDGKSCRIEVEDNGVGFDMSDLGRMFQMFQRLHSNIPGTGVGLALVARAASRLGGKVRSESSPGKGARFALEIPYFVVQPDAFARLTKASQP